MSTAGAEGEQVKWSHCAGEARGKRVCSGLGRYTLEIPPTPAKRPRQPQKRNGIPGPAEVELLYVRTARGVQVATRSLPQLACRATGLTGPTAARFSTHHGLIDRVGMRCGHRADIVAQFSKLFFYLSDPGVRKRVCEGKE